MEAAVSSAVSMATKPLAPSRAPYFKGAIGKRKPGFESSMSGRLVAVPQRRRDVMRLCAGEVRLAGEVIKKPVETKAESESAEPPTFPLLDLFEFITSGPLLKKTGFSEELVSERIAEWITIGAKLSRQLRFDEFRLSHSEKVRIYHYYVPVFLWCQQELQRHTAKFKKGEEVPPLVIGISAPQGCGKTTIVYSLEYLFNALGSRAASISIDDFYLTASEQKKLSASNPGNKLLEMRGNAGSHDLQLGTETLNALRSLTTSGSPPPTHLALDSPTLEASPYTCSSLLFLMFATLGGLTGKEFKIPRYNKSANAGSGDRADPSQWSKIKGPVKVVLFEGWMLGFEPQDESAVTAVDSQLAAVNRNLEPYYDAWHKFIDSWVVIQVDDPNWVFQWRLQAEIAMRADGRAGMTDEQVADFVSRYIPAYKAYLPALYKQSSESTRKEHTLLLQIDESRNPIS